MNLFPTELNLRLADVLNNRVAADNFPTAGRTRFLRLLGVGILGLGLGAAIGLGFYSYSHITRHANNAEVLSSTFAKALANVELNVVAEGVVEFSRAKLYLRLAKPFRSNRMLEPVWTRRQPCWLKETYE